MPYIKNKTWSISPENAEFNDGDYILINDNVCNSSTSCTYGQLSNATLIFKASEYLTQSYTGSKFYFNIILIAAEPPQPLPPNDHLSTTEIVFIIVGSLLLSLTVAYFTFVKCFTKVESDGHALLSAQYEP